MITVDCETGGLNPKENPILSIGAVEYENDDNQFYIKINPIPGLFCTVKAMQVNGIILKTWNGTDLHTAMSKFNEWIQKIDDKTLAGHNPSFDRDFCNVNFNRIGLGNVFNHRTVDLHSLAYAKFRTNKLYSDKIYSLLGMEQEPKPHNALNGAIWETKAFRKLMEDE